MLLVAQKWCRRLLDEFLVASLERAVPGGDDLDVAVAIGEALRFHVARCVEVALNKAFSTAERCDCLASRGVEELAHLTELTRDFQTAPAPAECRLDGDWEAVLLGKGDHFARIFDGILGARNERRSCRLGNMACGDLVAELLDGLGTGADPHEASVNHGLREVRTLRQEPVARVDCFSAASLRDVEKLVDHEIALRGARSAEGVGLVRDARVQSVAIRVGIHGDRSQPGIAAGTGNAYGDLTTIGNENRVERSMERGLRHSGSFSGVGRSAQQPSEHIPPVDERALRRGRGTPKVSDRERNLREHPAKKRKRQTDDRVVIALDAFNEGAAVPVDREGARNPKRFARRHVRVDLGIGKLSKIDICRCRIAERRPRSAIQRVAIIDEPVPRMKSRPLSSHLPPPLACGIFRAGFAYEGAIDLEHRIAPENDIATLARRARRFGLRSGECQHLILEG